MEESLLSPPSKEVISSISLASKKHSHPNKNQARFSHQKKPEPYSTLTPLIRLPSYIFHKIKRANYFSLPPMNKLFDKLGNPYYEVYQVRCYHTDDYRILKNLLQCLAAEGHLNNFVYQPEDDLRHQISHSKNPIQCSPTPKRQCLRYSSPDQALSSSLFDGWMRASSTNYQIWYHFFLHVYK